MIEPGDLAAMDQVVANVAQIAAAFFAEFQNRGFTRQEALALTQQMLALQALARGSS